MIKVGEIDAAKKALTQTEKLAETLEDKGILTNLYKELALQQMRERNFSQNIFKNSEFLYKDKPDFSKIEKLMEDYENEHLSTLTNFQWFAYPFVKTIRVVLRKVGCCRDRDIIKGTKLTD